MANDSLQSAILNDHAKPKGYVKNAIIASIIRLIPSNRVPLLPAAILIACPGGTVYAQLATSATFANAERRKHPRYLQTVIPNFVPMPKAYVKIAINEMPMHEEKDK